MAHSKGYNGTYELYFLLNKEQQRKVKALITMYALMKSINEDDVIRQHRHEFSTYVRDGQFEWVAEQWSKEK